MELWVRLLLLQPARRRELRERDLLDCLLAFLPDTNTNERKEKLDQIMLSVVSARNEKDGNKT